MTHDEAISTAQAHTKNEDRPFGVIYDRSIIAPAKERFSIVALQHVPELSQHYPYASFLHGV